MWPEYIFLPDNIDFFTYVWYKYMWMCNKAGHWPTVKKCDKLAHFPKYKGNKKETKNNQSYFIGL